MTRQSLDRHQASSRGPTTNGARLRLRHRLGEVVGAQLRVGSAIDEHD